MFRIHKGWCSVTFFIFLSIIVEVPVTGRECCPTDTFLLESSKFCSNNVTEYNLECEYGAWLLDPNTIEADNFSFDPQENVLMYRGVEVKDGKFCISRLFRNKSVSEKQVALVCFGEDAENDDVISTILRLLILISTLFLLVTLYIYVILPNLRDLQGKCVMAFICCLIASYVTLFVVQTFPNSSQEACVMQAASLYFFMSCYFFWSNIITFNIWKAARISRVKVSEKTWSIIYVCWGFGVPLVMVLLSFILEHVPGGDHIRPHFAETRCWFRGKKETWSYFYGPISVLLLLNIFMYLQSCWTLWKSYKNSTIPRVRSLRFKCMMYLKLFLIMGITWTFEVISYATSDNPNNKYLWFVTDCLNGAQGVIIFLILVVFRQKVRLGLLNKKLCNLKWPQTWVKEEIEESSTVSVAEELELANQKLKMIVESQKENGHD